MVVFWEETNDFYKGNVTNSRLLIQITDSELRRLHQPTNLEPSSRVVRKFYYGGFRYVISPTTINIECDTVFNQKRFSNRMIYKSNLLCVHGE